MKHTLDLPLDAPGLLKREIVEQTSNSLVIRETWDTKVDGCPLVIVRPPPELAFVEYYSQWTPEELAALGNSNAPPIFTVRDERASAATTFVCKDE